MALTSILFFGGFPLPKSATYETTYSQLAKLVYRPVVVFVDVEVFVMTIHRSVVMSF